MTTHETGPYGNAEQLQLGTGQRYAQTADWWLVDAPGYHPAWRHYMVMCVRLDDNVPGFPPPKRRFPEATHEFLIVALDPRHEPWTAKKASKHLAFLEPVNICEQFTAGDNEMRELCQMACHAIVNGILNPETADAPTQIRATWRESLTKTLAHLRGEDHTP